MIPRGSKHPREAFEFIAYVQRQDVMEKLCQSHCKNSPLATQSDDWVFTHPNPFIDVFICKLRKKLAQATGGEHFIETVWGRGYVLRDPDPRVVAEQAA
jgi:hypothetical protein